MLLAGFHPRPDEFVHDLLKVNPVLAARCIYEGRASVSDAVRQQVIRALLSLIEDTSNIALRVRIAAGEALGESGDTRFRFVDLTTGQDVTSDELKARIWRGDNPEDRERYLILPPTVPIVSAGEKMKFTMGYTEDDIKKYRRALGKRWREEWGESSLQGKVELGGYDMGKFLVTYREYRQFIDDCGYDKSDDARWRDCWWKDENGQKMGWNWLQGSGQDAPMLWDDRRFNKPNSPIVGVTWFEAVAYCNWLNAKIGQLVNWSIGRHHRLPTEAQWEYAARGDERWLFPWGVEPPLGEAVARLCNIYEGDTKVTQLPPQPSPLPQPPQQQKKPYFGGKSRRWPPA